MDAFEKELTGRTALRGEDGRGVRVLGERERLARIRGAEGAKRADMPPPPPCVRLEILDKATVRELDPLLLDGSIVPCWHALEGPAVVRVEGVETLRVAPAPAGTAPTMQLSSDVYAAMVRELGVDDDGATSENWTEQGAAAVREAMANAPPDRGLPALKGELPVRRAMAAAVGCWFGLPPTTIAELTGAPYAPRRSLLAPCGKARSLDLIAARERAEAEAAAKRRQREAEAERTPNARTCAELGLEGVVVDLDGFEAHVPPSFASTYPTCTDAARQFFVWRSIEGLPLPAGAVFGCAHTLRGDEVLSAPARVLEQVRAADGNAFGFTIRARRQFLPDADRGPVTGLSKDGERVAVDVAKRYAPALYQPNLDQRWLARHVVELLIRGARVAPVAAAAILWDALLAEHAARTGAPVRVPRGRRRGPRPPGAPAGVVDGVPVGAVKDGKRAEVELVSEPAPAAPYAGDLHLDEIGRLAAEAAAGGEVEPGCLLPSRKKPAKGHAQ